MKSNDNVIEINNPVEESFNDPLTALAKQGAQRMLATAIEQEISDFLQKYKNEVTPDNHHYRKPNLFYNKLTKSICYIILCIT